MRGQPAVRGGAAAAAGGAGTAAGSPPQLPGELASRAVRLDTSDEKCATYEQQCMNNTHRASALRQLGADGKVERVPHIQILFNVTNKRHRV